MILLARVLDDRLSLHLIAELRWARHGQHVELCVEDACEIDSEVECHVGRLRAIVTEQDIVNHGVLPPGTSDAAAGDASGTCWLLLRSRCCGRKKAFAMSVGTTALPITAPTSAESCAWVTILWDNPKSAEMVLLGRVRRPQARKVSRMAPATTRNFSQLASPARSAPRVPRRS